MAEKIWADFHTHTFHSHGTGSIKENVQAARQKKLDVLAITDHGPASFPHIGVTDLSEFDQMRKEVDVCNEDFPDIHVLLGVEANIISSAGDLDVPLIKQKELDIILAGFHTMVWPISMKEGASFMARSIAAKFSCRGRIKARNENTKTVTEAVYRNKIDIITHPGLYIDINSQELAKACANTHTLLEINASHEMNPDFIKVTAGEGVNYVLSSDAHSPDKVGEVQKGIALMKKTGLSPERVINLRPKGEKGKWLKIDL